MTKKTLITVKTGQDGSYLAEFLLETAIKFMVLKGARHHFSSDTVIVFRSQWNIRTSK